MTILAEAGMDAQDIRSLATELDTTMALVHELVATVHADASSPARARELAAAIATRPNVGTLPGLLLRAYSEITEALGGIRLSREAIKAHAIDRLHKSQSKLNEVSSVTENATLELMNGLDRSLTLLDAIDAGAGETHHETVEALRGEVNQLFGHLQFQDITNQQLQGVGALLADIESRVEAVALLFDRARGAAESAVAEQQPAARLVNHATFNPDATVAEVESRQALADAAFAGAQGEPARTNVSAA